jgi:hypothetical protein
MDAATMRVAAADVHQAIADRQAAAKTVLSLRV